MSQLMQNPQPQTMDQNALLQALMSQGGGMPTMPPGLPGAMPASMPPGMPGMMGQSPAMMGQGLPAGMGMPFPPVPPSQSSMMDPMAQGQGPPTPPGLDQLTPEQIQMILAMVFQGQGQQGMPSGLTDVQAPGAQGYLGGGMMGSVPGSSAYAGGSY